jgi:peptide/nickel transport system substrate-binding protein
MAFTFLFYDLNITRGTSAPVTITSPFSFWGLRKCLAHAFDYDAAIDAIINGWGFQAKGFIPQGMFGNNPDIWEEHYNITAAVEFWNDAMNEPGFVESINALDGYVELFYNSGNVIREQGSLLLKDGLSLVMAHDDTNLTGITATMTNGEPGVELRVNALEWSNMILKMDNHELPMWLIGWAPDYADPDNYALPFVKSTGTFMHASGYNNTAVDALVAAGKAETDLVARQAIYDEMQELVAFDQPSIYMYQPSEFRVWRNWMAGNGLTYNPMYGTYYWYHLHKVYPTT